VCEFENLTVLFEKKVPHEKSSSPSVDFIHVTGELAFPKFLLTVPTGILLQIYSHMATGLVSLRHLATRTSTITAQPVFIGAGLSIRSFTTSTSQPQDRKQPPQAIQNWDDYFKLRAKRRNYERICCIPSSIAALGAAGTYFTQLEIDPLHTVFGMEALPVYGMATVLAVC
jgi:Mitochondrial import protein Pam17